MTGQLIYYTIMYSKAYNDREIYQHMIMYPKEYYSGQLAKRATMYI